MCVCVKKNSEGGGGWGSDGAGGEDIQLKKSEKEFLKIIIAKF